MKKNIVVIGTGNSVYIKDFCNKVLEGFKNIVLVTNEINEEDACAYGHDVRIIHTNKPFGGINGESLKEGKRIKGLCTSQIGRYDMCQIHYSDPAVIYMFHPIWRFARKRILTFWGSDIYTLKANKRKRLLWFCVEATDLIFVEENILWEFQEVFGHKFDKKCHVIDFGMPLYEEMRKLVTQGNKNESKCMYGVPTDHISIHVGYNGSEGQHHKEILSELAKLPSEIKDKIYLTVPFGYGASEKYKEEIKLCLEETGIRGILQENFLDRNKTAHLRNSCDIFLYGRQTDGASSSVLEYAYVGAKIAMHRVVSSNYYMFTTPAYEYWIYNDYSDLSLLIQEELIKKDKPNNLEELRKHLKETMSWEHFAPMWKEVLESDK